MARLKSQSTNSQNIKNKDNAPFPVVGIGASAGGLAAIESFFSGMPQDDPPGMAFVIVQHLAPDHKSILSDLIRRYTQMTVREVEDGMIVQPNNAYIIPPNHDLAFINGRLQLLTPSAPRGKRLPIDFFFRSLAQDQHEHTICIVLSGTGSDGTVGLRAVKGEGGMVMAQEPGSTEYDGMPRSAIATGLVDYVLPPAKMPAQLINYVKQAYSRISIKKNTPMAKKENLLNKIFILLRGQTGHDFSHYKINTIQRRIDRRMAVHQIVSLDEYVKYLQQSPKEIEALFRDLLIGVTSFFRDPESFEILKKKIIPQLFKSKSSDATIRVWSAGCSTGEEAYSVAILLQEYLESIKTNYKIQIFATDIDSNAIATARSGLYPASISADISQERLDHFFVCESDGSGYRIHKTVRDMLIFSEQNIIKDPPFSRLDMIVCRNLLIYLDGELQKKIIPMFHYALNPSGYLFLGTSESIGDLGDIFRVNDRKHKIYERLNDQNALIYSSGNRFIPPSFHNTGRQLPEIIINQTPKLPLRELTEQYLMETLAPVAALVNNKGEILYLHGRSGMYLEPVAGEAGVNNILKMARFGLQQELTIALHKAISSKQQINLNPVKVKTNGDYTRVNLTIRPIETENADDARAILYLIILMPVSGSTTSQDSAYPPDENLPIDIDLRIASLKQELQAKEEYLQSTNEELETSNEELKSSNEEMQSVNEELQSTNEELETSKEELQSVNEELATVNVELQEKVIELSRANNDMNNLLAGTGIGTIFVDHQLNILRFTPAATQIINLIHSDVGRPVAHIVSNLTNYSSLVDDLKSVLKSLIGISIDVLSLSGKWYNMRIQPYRTLENVIEGAVLTFVDISDVKTSQEILHLNSERIRVAISSASLILFNHDPDLTYTWINTTGSFLSPDSVLGKKDSDLFLPAEAKHLMESKKQVLKSGEGIQTEIFLTLNQNTNSYILTIEPLINVSQKIIGLTCAMILKDKYNKADTTSGSP
jgi:two-component system CheB/CheR fusion protein